MALFKSGSSGISLERMSVEQLIIAVNEQANLEVNLLQDSLSNICTAITRLEIASTTSLYVPSTLDDAHKALVRIGYFIEYH